MPKNSGKEVTYDTKTSVPKFNISNLSLAEIENELEYLLFVDHEESMESYTHLRPILKEVAELVIHISDRAVRDFQRDMTYRVAEHLKANVANVVFGSEIPTYNKATVSVTIDDEKVVRQTMSIEEDIRDW
jgi:hypothetical protein